MRCRDPFAQSLITARDRYAFPQHETDPGFRVVPEADGRQALLYKVKTFVAEFGVRRWGLVEGSLERMRPQHPPRTREVAQPPLRAPCSSSVMLRQGDSRPPGLHIIMHE
jgi:hypothetical protein